MDAEPTTVTRAPPDLGCEPRKRTGRRKRRVLRGMVGRYRHLAPFSCCNSSGLQVSPNSMPTTAYCGGSRDVRKLHSFGVASASVRTNLTCVRSGDRLITLNFSLMTSGPYRNAGLTSGLLEAHDSQKCCSNASSAFRSSELAATLLLSVKCTVASCCWHFWQSTRRVKWSTCY